MTRYIRAQPWDGQTLRGVWCATRKLDGVQLIVDGGVGTTRGGSPVAVPDTLENGVYEYFPGSWSDAMRRIAQHGDPPLAATDCYRLLPVLDDRLVLGWIEDASPEDVRDLLAERRQAGDEGLVFWADGADPIKVKPMLTMETTVRDVIEGTGRLVGTMGKLVTTHGVVANGFTLDERDWFWQLGAAARGLVIEVSFTEYTKAGVWRHPRFARLRSELDTTRRV